MAVVYGLVDPTTNELRYVGQTVNLQLRLRHHWKPVSLAKQTHVARWLRGLRESGARPEILLLDDVDRDQVYDAEQFWIAYFRGRGCRLTNLSDRGPGGRPKGWHHTEATKAKIRAARAQQSNPRLGTKHTEETRQLMSEQRRGKPRSESWRRAIALAMTGKKRGPYKARTTLGVQ